MWRGPDFFPWLQYSSLCQCYFYTRHSTNIRTRGNTPTLCEWKLKQDMWSNDLENMCQMLPPSRIRTLYLPHYKSGENEMTPLNLAYSTQ